MNHLSRSTALKIAAVLSFLQGLYGIYLFLPYLPQGSAALNADLDTPPYIIVVIALALALVSIVAAYGAWQSQRWGIALTILVAALNALSGAPGILFAPTTALWVSATSGTVWSIIVIVLCLWRERKRVAI